MFQHVEPFAGDPILSLNEDFQRDPRPGKINLSIGIYFDDAGRIPVLDSVRAAEATVGAAAGPKPYLPIEGAANFRAAVQQLLFGDGHEAIRIASRGDAAIGRLERRTEGRRRLHRALVSAERGLGQRPDVGQPPLDVRGRRPRGPHLSLLRRGQRRARVRCDARPDADAAAAQHRAAARLLPQPDRGRPDARAMGSADPGIRPAPAAALPRPGLPGFRRRHRGRRVRGARPRRGTRPRRPAAQLLRRQFVLQEHEPLR